jgi:uncharacterized protein (DUF1810 family)
MPPVNDPYDLQRFVEAQDPVYDQVCAELRRGQKTSHWMWFIFPQLRGLGRSQIASTFGISSRKEAEAYVRHPVLGKRLKECTHLVNMVEGRPIHQIFGFPDDLKFHSSVSLFANASPDNQEFTDALQKYFGGKLDTRTMEILAAGESA